MFAAPWVQLYDHRHELINGLVDEVFTVVPNSCLYAVARLCWCIMPHAALANCSLSKAKMQVPPPDIVRQPVATEAQ